MLETLLQLGIFIIQTIIIVAAILIVIAGIVAIASKGKMRDKIKLRLRKLNKHYDDIADTINKEIMSKTEYKKFKKTKKSTAKKAKQSAKQKKANLDTTTTKPHVFVLNFDGDLKASQVSSLREEITAILMIARPHDKVLLRLESAGGMVHGYGLAASQLQRLRNAAIPLVIAVDKVAASGGYMMASVADKIIAAPFAILGSIGVIAQLPNFHRFLKKHNIDFEQITAGEYKRTLTLFGENTSSGRHKLKEDIEDAHELFKSFISQYRPQVDMGKVATGEHWFARRAIELKLVDELTTSDDYLLNASKQADIFEVTYKKKPKLHEKLCHSTQALLTKFISLVHKETDTQNYLI